MINRCRLEIKDIAGGPNGAELGSHPDGLLIP